MAHAHHFLSRLDRAPRAVVDEALALYRDPERAVWILSHVPAAAGAERVALSLGEGDAGPFVVVTREGRFVTCLGEGMSTGALPIISRARVTALGAQLDEQRARQELAGKRAAASGHKATSVLSLVVARGDALSREDFLAVSAFEALLRVEHARDYLETVNTLEDTRPALVRTIAKGSRPPPNILDGYWKLLQSIGHLALLVGMGPRDWLLKLNQIGRSAQGDTFTVFAVTQRHLGVALKAAWLAARIGKQGIAEYAPVLASPVPDPIAKLDAALAITGIGLRHANHRDDARRALAPLATVEGGGEFAPILHRTANMVLDDPDEAARRARELGVPLAKLYVDNFGGDDKPEITDEIAKLALITSDSSAFRIDDGLAVALLALATVARGEPEEFYVPDALRPLLGAVPNHPLRIASFLRRAFAKMDPVDEPVRRSSPKVGRNDPCPCGSGKKAKKCCGTN